MDNNNKDDENVIVQVTVQKADTVNKNGRIYNQDNIKEALRKHQLSTIYGIIDEEKSEEIKIKRLENNNEGFRTGYMYCFSRHLEDIEICKKCESREQCIKDKHNEEQRLENIQEFLNIKQQYDFTTDDINQAIRRFQEKYGN